MLESMNVKRTQSLDGFTSTGPDADSSGEVVPTSDGRTEDCDSVVGPQEGDGGATADVEAYESGGDESLDASVESVESNESDGSELPTNVGGASCLAMHPGESPEAYMLRLREAAGAIPGLLRVDNNVDGKTRNRSSGKPRNVVSNVQIQAGNNPFSGKEKPRRIIFGATVRREEGMGSETGGSGEEGENSSDVRNSQAMESDGCEVVGGTAQTEVGSIQGVYSFAGKGVPEEAIRIGFREVRGSLVGVIDHKDFLQEQTSGVISPEVYESTYDIDPLKAQDAPPVAFGQSMDSVISRMGGKRQLKAWLCSVFPRGIQTYVEPFGGSFQVLLQKPYRDPIEIVNDVDADIIHFFRYLVYSPKQLITFINMLPTHEALILGFREGLARKELSGLERAAAMYICTASSFNAKASMHYGRYGSSPHVLIDTSIDESLALRVARRLRGVDIRCTSYERLLKAAIKEIPGGLFIYMDPPYDQTVGYDSYQGELSFGWKDHVALSEFCAQIDSVGGRFIQTNSATDRLRELYGSYKKDGQPMFRIQSRNVYYSVAGTAAAREEKEEFIISNYDLGNVESGRKKENRYEQTGLWT